MLLMSFKIVTIFTTEPAKLAAFDESLTHPLTTGVHESKHALVLQADNAVML